MSGCKICSICHLIPPYRNSSRCKSCSSVYAKKRYNLIRTERLLASRTYYTKNHKTILAKQRKKSLDKFGLKEYGRVCDICGAKPNNRSLTIDHCHQTNTFRGFLCDSCNLGLGKFYDSEELLKKAITYIKNHKKLFPR